MGTGLADDQLPESGPRSEYAPFSSRRMERRVVTSVLALEKRVPVLVTLFVSLVVVGAAASQAGGSATLACSPRWRVVAETSGPWLSDVAALSPTDVWMVGSSGDPRRRSSAAIHWDGRLLRRYVPFRAGRAGGGVLWRVSAVAPEDVWAWGEDGKGRSGRDVVVHWNGREWEELPSPSLPGRAYSYDFAATGSNSAWLVGGGMADNRPLVMHWDGTRWGILNLRWSVAPSGSDLRAITVRTPNDVWAVGAQGLNEPVSFGYTDLVLHWNGRRWHQAPSPLLRGYDSGPYAIAVGAAASRDIWTANQDLSGNNPVFVHFPAHNERPTVHTPEIEFDPYDIEPVSANSGWVAGASEYPSRSVLVHWSGSRWHTEHIPHADLKAEPTWSLSVLSPIDVWAAGSRLLARYSC